MDETFEDKAQEAADNLEQAAESSWQAIEFAANQAAEQTRAAAEDAQAAWQQPQQPPAHTPPYRAPQYQQPQYAPNDPNRWTGELYTPEATPPDQTYSQTAQGQYIDTQRVGQAPPPPVKKDNDSFPAWAIVLIVLLVLLICIACTFLPILLTFRAISQFF